MGEHDRDITTRDWRPELEAAVRDRLSDALVEVLLFRGETTLVVTKERIIELLSFLRDDALWRFDRLADLTAVDYLQLEREPRFGVVYHLMSRTTLRRLRVRALVEEAEPVIDSVVPLYPVANWFEREVYDLFGIVFAGHPNLSRIMMPDDWEGHPLRKDFPVGMEEVAFSFNADAHLGVALGAQVGTSQSSMGRDHVAARVAASPHGEE